MANNYGAPSLSLTVRSERSTTWFGMFATWASLELRLLLGLDLDPVCAQSSSFWYSLARARPRARACVCVCVVCVCVCVQADVCLMFCVLLVVLIAAQNMLRRSFLFRFQKAADNALKGGPPRFALDQLFLKEATLYSCIWNGKFGWKRISQMC